MAEFGNAGLCVFSVSVLRGINIQSEGCGPSQPDLPSSVMFEVLYGPFVLFCRCPSVEGSKVFPLPRFRIDFARIEPVLAGFQFSNHGILFPRNAYFRTQALPRIQRPKRLALGRRLL